MATSKYAVIIFSLLSTVVFTSTGLAVEDKPLEFSGESARKYTPLKTEDRGLFRVVDGLESSNFTFQDNEVRVKIDTTNILRTTNSNFLSIALDSNIIKERWKTFDFKSERLYTLAKSLSPCYLRLGGTEEDFLTFNHSTYSDYGLARHKNFTNFTMTVEDWDDINQFSEKVGWKLIFGLNVLLRNHDNRWDYTNAMELIEYTIKRGYHVDWELGNEPNSFRKTTGRELDASILAEDFKTLRGILESRVELKNCLLAGPDITSSGLDKYYGFGIHPDKYLDAFLRAAPDVTNATTWHQYYIDGKTAVLDNFTDPNILDMLIREIEKVKNIVNRYKPGSSIWLGETGSAYGGGAPNLSDAYVAGFMWLDKLGVAAANGLDIVIRQQFYNGHYALLDKHLNPNPDYWLSVIYKRLVGSKVLSAKVTNFDLYSNEVTDNNGCVRVYAHCTAGTDYPLGSVTMYALSLCKESTTKIVLSDDLSKLAVDEYLLTPHGDEALTTKRVDLNGKILKMPSDSTLPDFVPRHLQPGDDILIPPLTFGFFVLVDAGVKIC